MEMSKYRAHNGCETNGCSYLIHARQDPHHLIGAHADHNVTAKSIHDINALHFTARNKVDI